jgi:hypothetical protein
MQRSDWFAVLVAIFVLGAGAYLSTFSAEIISKIGLILMVLAVIGLVIWFASENRWPKMNIWGPWILIIGGPILGLLWLFLPPIQNKNSTLAPQDRWIWNALTPSEIDTLYGKLRNKDHHSILISCNRPECSDLASSFDQLFKRLGWPSVIGDAGILAVGVTGIMINPSDSVADALKEAIETTTSLRPELGPPREARVT